MPLVSDLLFQSKLSSKRRWFWEIWYAEEKPDYPRHHDSAINWLITGIPSSVCCNLSFDAKYGSNFLQGLDLLWINSTAIDRQSIICTGSSVLLEVRSSPLLDIVSPFLSSLISCAVETVLR